MNNRWILTFDLETDGKDPTDCNPVQLAAVPIDPHTLDIKKDLAFNVMIKPDGIDDLDTYLTPARESTIAWHAKIHNTTNEDIIERWKKGVSEKIAWKSFINYAKKYTIEKKKGQWFPQPIPAGYNITGFDLPIIDRLCEKHKTKSPFAKVTKLDAMHMLFWWFENLEEPDSYSMDNMRKFLGIKLEGGIAHDGLTDVYEESAIVTRFMKFHRKQSTVEKFKGSFEGVEI